MKGVGGDGDEGCGRVVDWTGLDWRTAGEEFNGGRVRRTTKQGRVADDAGGRSVQRSLV